MADIMPDVPTNDDSFEIAQVLLDFSANDQGESINKWIDSLMQILRSVTNRCRKLADFVDATIALHADEMERTKQVYEAKLNEMKGQITKHLTSLELLNDAYQTKTTTCDRLTHVLRLIHGQIRDLLVSMDIMDRLGDGDLNPSEHGNDVIGEGATDHGDDDDDASQHTGQLNDDDILPRNTSTPQQQQHDANQGESDDAQMSSADDDEENRNENDADGQGDKENVQPQNGASSSAAAAAAATTSVPLHPALTARPLADMSNTNPAKQCFKCIETFVQESAFLDHLYNFHGIPIQRNDNEDENENHVPGQYARNPQAKRRKRLSPADDIALDENANSRIPKRKIKIRKAQSASQAPAN